MHLSLLYKIILLATQLKDGHQIRQGPFNNILKLYSCKNFMRTQNIEYENYLYHYVYILKL